MKRSVLLALSVALVAVGVLAACSKGSTSFNDADVTFVKHMIPHHEQAVAMARTVESNASSAEVKTLAGRIEKAQAPEIEKMKSWLKSWGKPETPATGSDMSNMDRGKSMGMGIMSADEMDKLRSLRGAAFDKQFLSMMIKHHQGAIEMAKTELNDGEDKDAKAMAQDIIKAQETEITRMQSLLVTAAK